MQFYVRPFEKTRAALERALFAERGNIPDALALYEEAEKSNTVFKTDIVLAAVFGPILGGLAAFYATRQLVDRQTWIALAIIVASYAPVWLLLSRHMISLGIERPPQLLMGIFTVLMPLLLIFSEVMTIGLILFLAALTMLPFLFGLNAVAYFQNGPPFTPFAVHETPFITIIAGLSITFWLLFVFADLNPRELFHEPFKELLEVIPVGLWYRRLDILQFFGAIFLGSILVGLGPLGILYEHLWETLAAMSFSGLCLGLSTARLERNIEAGHQVSLGKMRCYAVMGKFTRVRYHAMRIDMATQTGKNKGIERMAWALHLFCSPSRREVERKRICLQVQHSDEYNGQFPEFWERARSRVKEITGCS